MSGGKSITFHPGGPKSSETEEGEKVASASFFPRERLAPPVERKRWEAN